MRLDRKMVGFRSYLAVLAAVGLVLVASAKAATFTTLYSIAASQDGAYSRAALIDVGGQFYGTTVSGGANFYGTVFKVNPTTGAETVLYSFTAGSDGRQPYAPLIDVAGTLYGTTRGGGSSGHGTVFSINPTTGAETVLYSFKGGADGYYPEAALIDVSGTLYGTTVVGGASNSGTVFSINPTTGVETVVYSFKGGSDGYQPNAALININGTLYGTTPSGGASGYGTVFAINPTTGTETFVYSFKGGADGYYPEAALIDVSGTLYGTTINGGSSGHGTVFSIGSMTGSETVVYSFKGASDGYSPYAALVDAGGTLFGTTQGGGASGYGTVFSINPTTGVETVLYNFTGGPQGGYFLSGYPYAALIDVDGILYGTTYYGGTSGAGTVFSINPTAGAENLIHSFTGSIGSHLCGQVAEFSSPVLCNALLNLNGTLVLSAITGGGGSIGDIVKISPTTAVVKDLYAFKNYDLGAFPTTALTQVGGTLYGTAFAGGASGYGTVFKINPTTGAQTVLHNFTGSPTDGANPSAALINVGGTLYGTTQGGGATGSGTVFSINPTSGAETIVYSFKGFSSDGANPSAALMNVGSTLYGTTVFSGASYGNGFPGYGTVFKINMNTGVETLLYSFKGGSDGAEPSAALISVGGTLYGTTSNSGYYGEGGTVFSINPTTGLETVLHSFTGGSDGGNPQDALINVGGILYGTTRDGGASNYGTVFSINLATGTETVLYSFTIGGSGGGLPYAALANVGTTLYGVTSAGSAKGYGSVFKLAP